MTITDVAERIGVTTKTIVRWEKAGKNLSFQEGLEGMEGV
jgi:DNA-binding transcriptional MerR regulator